MSNFTKSKVPAILVGLSLFVLSSYPALAEDQPIGAKVLPVIRKEATEVGTTKMRALQLNPAIRKEALKNNLEDIKDKIASETAAFRARIEKFKDQQKAAIAERINTNLNKINQKYTAQMKKHLTTMSEILDKLEKRIDEGKPDIKNPAAAKTAIVSARNAIATASAAISVQAQKDYTIQVTSESMIGKNAKTQRDKLHSDILALRKIIIDAKQSVGNAIRIAKSEALINPAATTSGKNKTRLLLNNNSKTKKEGTESGE